MEEAGQALLWLTGDAAGRGALPFLGLRRRRSSHSEAYEEHFLLPDDRVALLTSQSILLVIAPTFAQLHAAAEAGELAASGEATMWTAMAAPSKVCFRHIQTQPLKRFSL